MEGPVPEVHLLMDCIGGEWETLDGEEVHVPRHSLVDPEFID